MYARKSLMKNLLAVTILIILIGACAPATEEPAAEEPAADQTDGETAGDGAVEDGAAAGQAEGESTAEEQAADETATEEPICTVALPELVALPQLIFAGSRIYDEDTETSHVEETVNTWIDDNGIDLIFMSETVFEKHEIRLYQYLGHPDDIEGDMNNFYQEQFVLYTSSQPSNQISPEMVVFVDVNYLSGVPVSFHPLGSPGGAGGGPLGSPGGTGGGPLGSPGGTGGGPRGENGKLYEDGDDFDLLDQWVFNGQHANLSHATFSDELVDGTDVTVAIFDTGGNESFVDPGNSDLADCIEEATANESQSAGDHGFFIERIVKAVAPKAITTHYKVLDESGIGDAYTLTRALIDFAINQEEGSQAVINLSLGLGSTEPYLPGLGNNLECEEDCQGIQEMANESRNIQAGIPPEQELAMIFLQIPIQILTDNGNVVVAAAGNDSHTNANTERSQQAPASFLNVIGVASSNFSNDRSCFSNHGDILAPSGDMRLSSGQGSCNSNTSWEDLCPYDEDEETLLDANDQPFVRTPCGSGIISYTSNGTAIWTGTSFSTPIVGGTAALMMNKALECPELEPDITAKLLQTPKNSEDNRLVKVTEAVLNTCQ